MSAFIAGLFALLATVAIIVATHHADHADRLRDRNDRLADDLARRDAQIGDMLEHIHGQAADYATLAATCAQQKTRINHMLDIMHTLDATIIEQARTIAQAQRQTRNLPTSDFIFPN